MSNQQQSATSSAHDLKALHRSRSLWAHPEMSQQVTASPPDVPVDVLVVGAGINGALVALRAARAGLTVRVLEAYDRPGTLASGLNTGKVCALQGRQLSNIDSTAGRKAAAQYARDAVEAVRFVREFCEEVDLPHQVVDSGLSALRSQDVDDLRTEHDLAQTLGLDTVLRDAPTDAGYAVASLTLADQLQLDPSLFLQAVLREAQRAGATIQYGSRVRRQAPSSTGSVATLVDGRTVEARHMVYATGAPLPARGGYFTRLSAHRSYQVAFAGPLVETPALISIGGMSRSIRSVSGADFSLIVGGEGHPTGRAGSELQSVQALVDWAAEAFPEHTPVGWWSAQDYITGDHRPLVESLPVPKGTISVVTGMNKWGLTNAVTASAKVLEAIEGQTELPGALAGLRKEIKPERAVAFLQRNSAVAVAEVVGSCRAARDVSVGKDGVRGAGICSHVGGTLVLNDATGTLDCPLHGSRFERDGAVIEGYTTRRALTVGNDT
ncbi:FAD-dependent oxidoreductase [Nocardioides salsibiostraticola]